MIIREIKGCLINIIFFPFIFSFSLLSFFFSFSVWVLWGLIAFLKHYLIKPKKSIKHKKILSHNFSFPSLFSFSLSSSSSCTVSVLWDLILSSKHYIIKDVWAWSCYFYLFFKFLFFFLYFLRPRIFFHLLNFVGFNSVFKTLNHQGSKRIFHVLFYLFFSSFPYFLRPRVSSFLVNFEGLNSVFKTLSHQGHKRISHVLLYFSFLFLFFHNILLLDLLLCEFCET